MNFGLFLILSFYFTCVYYMFIMLVHYFILLLNLKKLIQMGPTILDFKGCLTLSLRNNLNPLTRSIDFIDYILS